MKKTILLCIFIFFLFFQAFLAPEVGADVITLEATYSVDVNNSGVKYYHDGNDWVGRGSSGALRAVNRWDMSGIDPSWDIVSVEVRFYTESKTGSPGALSINRYGTSHGEDNPQTDAGTQVYSKIAGTAYASLPEPSTGSWTGWINLGSAAVSDITWCRDGNLSTWALGLKASDAIETSTTVRHVDFSEDNEANDAELRITYTQSSSPNTPPTATIDSITPNPANSGESVTFTGHGVDTDGTIAAYEWTSSISGTLTTTSTFSTSSLSAGTHTISFRVQDDDGAWSAPVTSSVTVTGGAEVQVTLEATYSVDVNNSGVKYYHDGNDWVGRGSSGALRAVNRWDMSGIDPSWDIVSVEVRFYTESKTGSPGALSINRYGTSHGEDNPQTDAGTQVYSKIAGTAYASLPEPSTGSWTGWINLGSAAVSDITWCRDGNLSTWALGLKASDAIETSTTVRHVDFSEDNEANDAELRITYTQSSSPNTPPTATIDSITPNPANSGESVTFTGHGNDTDGTVTTYEWTSSITGILSAASTFSMSSLSPGTHTISLRVRDDDNAWSAPVTSSVTVNASPNAPPTATIDSITPNPATTGQTITFTGHGDDTDGTIATYEWSSTINGVLSTSATSTYSTSTLSPGTHTISLRVRDDDNAWSAPVTSSVTVNASPNAPPTATIDSITPNPATTGQTITFTGHGDDTDGTVTTYEWSSSINGLLSTANTYSTSTLSAGTHTISLRVQDDDGAWSSPVTRSLTVNSSTSGTTEHMYICLGYRIAWQWNAKAGLEYLLRSMGAQKDGDAWRYVNQTLKKEFVIRFVEDIDSMKLALQEEGAHVLFQGHSNYGLGPVFATIEEVQNQYIEDIYWMDDPKIFNISSPWVSFSPKSMRTGHAFPDWWPEFQDGSSAIMPYNFNDPSVDPPYNYYLTYRIPGDPNLYKVEPVHDGAIERFPDSEKPAWYSPDGRSPDPTKPEELQYFLTNLNPVDPPVSVVGEWTWSREVSGLYKENYFYRPAGTGQGKVEWLFTIQEPGNYTISGWWPAASHHTTSARYTVNHSGGSNTFFVDQTKNGGQWNEFGQFYFGPGNYSVVLTDQASSGRVVADGVKITALSGILDKEIDNMVYPPPHYGKKTVMFRKDLDVQKESLRYRQLFYDSCNSGIYFLDTFNRGIAFFTLNDSSCLGFNAYVKAYLEGKSKDEIWRAMQDKSPIYDYYDFNKLPSEQ